MEQINYTELNDAQAKLSEISNARDGVNNEAIMSALDVAVQKQSEIVATIVSPITTGIKIIDGNSAGLEALQGSVTEEEIRSLAQDQINELNILHTDTEKHIEEPEKSRIIDEIESTKARLSRIGGVLVEKLVEVETSEMQETDNQTENIDSELFNIEDSQEITDELMAEIRQNVLTQLGRHSYLYESGTYSRQSKGFQESIALILSEKPGTIFSYKYLNDELQHPRDARFTSRSYASPCISQYKRSHPSINPNKIANILDSKGLVLQKGRRKDHDPNVLIPELSRGNSAWVVRAIPREIAANDFTPLVDNDHVFYNWESLVTPTVEDK
ncbi:MAG: hypothetical protein WCK80_03440 [bacterium]